MSSYSKPLARKSNTLRNVVIGISAGLLSVLLIVVIWKKDTIRVLLWPENIQVHSKSYVAGRIDSYKNVDWDGDNVTYQTQDNAFSFCVAFNGDKPSQIEGIIDIAKVNIGSVEEALDLGSELLSPFFEEADREAIGIILASKLMPLVADPYLELQTDIGIFSVSIQCTPERVLFFVSDIS